MPALILALLAPPDSHPSEEIRSLPGPFSGAAVDTFGLRPYRAASAEVAAPRVKLLEVSDPGR